jgi:SSS family solute:Na+ symporter
MNSELVTLAIAAMVITGIFTLILPLYITRKFKGSENWLVAGRSLSLGVATLLAFGTAFGGGALVARVGMAYIWGLAAITYNLCQFIGLTLLSMAAPWMRRHGFTAMGDIFRQIYGQNKALTSLVALMAIIPPLGGIGSGLISFANLTTPYTGVDVKILIIIFAILTALYVIPAGLRTVAWANVLMSLFIIPVAFTVAIYALGVAGGFGSIVSNVPSSIIAIPDGLVNVGWVAVMGWFASVGLGTLTNQAFMQNVFAAKDLKVARRSTFLTAILHLLVGCTYAVIVGLAIRAINPAGFTVKTREQSLGWFITTQVPPWLFALFIALEFTVIMSTLIGSLQPLVSILVKNIYVDVVNPKATDNKIVNATRILTVVMVFFIAGLATQLPVAMDFVLTAFGFASAALLVPIYLGAALHTKGFKLNPSVGVSAILAGFVVAWIGYVVGIDKITSVSYTYYGILASLIVLLIGAFLVKSKAQKPTVETTVQTSTN